MWPPRPVWPPARVAPGPAWPPRTDVADGS